MTFVDSEVPTLLGEPLDGLLFTASACSSALRLERAWDPECRTDGGAAR